MKRHILIANKRHNFPNWSLLISPKGNPTLQKDISQAYIKVNKVEQQVTNRMHNHYLRKHNLSTDSNSKLIKPLMTINQCKTSLEKSYSKSNIKACKKKSSLSQLDLGIKNDLNKIEYVASRIKNLVTERREAALRIRRPSPLSNLQICKAQNSSLTTEHSSIIKQSGLQSKMACKKPKSICEYRDSIINLSKKSVDMKERAQASSTKKLLKPIRIKVESKHRGDKTMNKHNSIEEIKAFCNFYKRGIQLPYVKEKKRFSMVLPSKEIRTKEQKKEGLKKRSNTQGYVKNLRRLLHLENDQQVSLVPEIKTKVGKTLTLVVHEPYFQSLDIKLLG